MMRSAFARHMAIFTLLILLTLSFLGGVLRLAVNSYLQAEKERTLSESAQAVANLTSAYGSVGELESSWDFRMSMSLASSVSGTDAVVCDESGKVLVCACDDFACGLVGQQADADWVTRTLSDGAVYATGPLPGLYEEERYVQSLRLTSQEGDVLGMVIVSSPVTDVAGAGRDLFRVFFYTALLVCFAALLVTAVLSRHEAQPMKELADTVRRFGHGDMKARAREGRGNTREMDELAAAFNNMADSLEKAERQRQEFVANVSHELKTPMTSIAGYLDGMLDGTIPPEMHGHYMRIVTDEVRRMSRLVRSMLEISRMQADGIPESRLSRFDLSDTAMQTLVTFEQKINQKRLEVDVQLPEKPLYTVAHKDSIVQVIYNLVDNAVKFCNDCGYLTIALTQDGGKARLTVQNTGPVIPAAELPFIFDRFHKLDKSRSKDPDGVGLGLYIVKTIIGAHGEDVWVESHDGVTAFTFTLPAVK